MIVYVYEPTSIGVLRRRFLLPLFSGKFPFDVERIIYLQQGRPVAFPEKDRGKAVCVGVKQVKLYDPKELPPLSGFKLADATLLGKKYKIGIPIEDLREVRKLASANQNRVRKIIPVNLAIFHMLKKKEREFAVIDFGFNSINFVGKKGEEAIIITENFGIFDVVDDFAFSQGVSLQEAWKAFISGNDFIAERIYLMLSDSLSSYTARFRTFDVVRISGPGIYYSEKDSSTPFAMIKNALLRLGFREVHPVSMNPIENEVISLIATYRAAK